jgi:acyl-coenzyme A synthetase/AMP-(fatty) acid ligase
MLQALLTEFAQRAPQVPVLLTEDGGWDATTLRELSAAWRDALCSSGKQSFAIIMPPSAQMIAAMVALSQIGASTVLLKPELSPRDIDDALERVGCDGIVCDSATADKLSSRARSWIVSLGTEDPGYRAAPVDRSVQSQICLFTSGTTGMPKVVAYRWAELIAATRVSGGDEGRRWLLAYNLAHFAGLQVLLHTLVNRETLIIANSGFVADIWRAGLIHSATHLSSTPTFWRVAFCDQACAEKMETLRHVTLGGEIVTQSVLDRIVALYPQVSISQIYASTELGSIVSVRDKRAGLPIGLFETSDAQGPLLRILNSELHVRASKSPCDYQPTGDLVEATSDRVVFLGRKSEVINVGGVKVHPQQVEAVVNPLEGVAASLADGYPNAIAGEIVRLRVVLRPGYSFDQVEPSIRSACSVLGRHAKPRHIVCVDELETANMKLARRKSS